MLDATAKKILGLLESGHATELRSAAARVLAEVGTRTPELTDTLCALLDDPEVDVRLQVLRTLGQLHIDKALPQLLQKVRQGGPEAEVAAESAARLGARGIKSLQDLMGEVPPGLRRRIAAALAAGGTSNAGAAAVDALRDTDPGVVDAAARSLLGEIPGYTAAQRRALADHVLALLAPKSKAPLSVISETALLRLLAALADSRAEAIFWSRLDSLQPVEVRATALQGLGAMPRSLGKDRLKRLLACAADRDFRVAAPAMMLLKETPGSDRADNEWLALLDAPDSAVRRFAIEKLGRQESAAIAGALVRQLGHPDRALHAAALERLGQMKQGRAALVAAVLKAENVDDAWLLARAQGPFAKEYSAAVRKQILAKASSYLEDGDRRADALLFLLREADNRALREELEEKAMALRKKKRYETALIYLRLLTRDPACGEAIRFELAACGLRLSEHNLAVESRAASPFLEQFARLIHSHEVDPGERLKQAKWLQPEDLFYLGFHFVEGDKPEREFGAQALRLLLKRSPRSKLAKDAKRKLRSAGLT
jgi:HEAT repeat protein